MKKKWGHKLSLIVISSSLEWIPGVGHTGKLVFPLQFKEEIFGFPFILLVLTQSDLQRSSCSNNFTESFLPAISSISPTNLFRGVLGVMNIARNNLPAY